MEGASAITGQTSITDLPRGCLVHILQFLQLSERLHDCSLVSTAWAEAAAAATTSISRSQADAACCRAVMRWASTCARHLSSLQLTGRSASPDCPEAAAVLQPLPLPALQQLQLLKVTLQLAAAPGPCSVSPLLSLSSLTELQLGSCSVLPDMRVLSALSALVHLQRLLLGIPVPVLQQSSSPAPEWSLPSSSTWSHLTALTHLDLGAQHNVTGPLLQQLCVLTQLQELLLYAPHLTTPGLQQLQQLPCLSTLDLQLAPHISFNSCSTPVLTHLQRLSLFCWRELQPGLLASLSQLQHLQLRAWAKRSSTTELTAFLAAVAQLTALTALSLQEVLLQLDPEQQPLGSMQQGELAPAACAALTASSVLHTLNLHHAELPAGAWSHMFPAGRQLPALRALVLSDVEQRLTDPEFEQLARCCPGLTGITLLRALQWGVSLEPLLPLQQLGEVELRHLHGDSALRLFAQMTRLRRLHNDDANVSSAGLSRLTALKRLTHLHMHCSADPWSLPRPVSISNKAPEWLLPDVWSQLQHLVKA